LQKLEIVRKDHSSGPQEPVACEIRVLGVLLEFIIPTALKDGVDSSEVIKLRKIVMN
jgi:hypothetical protein